ncbi:MAG: (2Fe-2S)-binding protein, partial [Pseudomonadota bacterium]
VSGQPETKAAVVAIERFEAAWHGFAVSANRPEINARYWARSRTEKGWRAELAGTSAPVDWVGYARHLFGLSSEPQVVRDPGNGITRVAFFDGDALAAALFVAPSPVAVARDFVAGLVGQPARDVLAARMGADRPDPGPIVCACMGVGRNIILAAAAGGADLGEVCAATGAGVTCGSCQPEIMDLIARASLRTAAE